MMNWQTELADSIAGEYLIQHSPGVCQRLTELRAAYCRVSRDIAKERALASRSRGYLARARARGEDPDAVQGQT